MAHVVAQTEDMQQEAIEVGKSRAMWRFTYYKSWPEGRMLTSSAFTAQEAMEKFNIEKVSLT